MIQGAAGRYGHPPGPQRRDQREAPLPRGPCGMRHGRGSDRDDPASGRDAARALQMPISGCAHLPLRRAGPGRAHQPRDVRDDPGRHVRSVSEDPQLSLERRVPEIPWPAENAWLRAAQAAGDEATAGLPSTRLASHEKPLWMMPSMLVSRAVRSRPAADQTAPIPPRQGGARHASGSGASLETLPCGSGDRTIGGLGVSAFPGGP